MTNRFATAALGLAALLALSATAEAATKLLVYTALEADQLKAYEAAFEAANPDVDLEWVRNSTGIITAKLLAEKDNPQADVVMGLAATSLMLLQKEGMLMPYAPARSRRYQAADARSGRSAELGRDGRLGVGALLQHGRSRSEEAAEADDLGRPDQARIHGPDRHAESGVVRHRLPDGLRLAADDGRGEGLGLHGQAAPEHRLLYAFRLEAVQAGGGRRVHDRPLVRVSRQHRRRTARRSTSCSPPKGSAGTWRRPAS